jgi:3-dehydroquinate synthase
MVLKMPVENTPDRLQVELGELSYPIYIGAGYLEQPQIWSKHIKGEQVVIITNPVLSKTYLDSVKRGLSQYQTHHIIIPDGERHKTLQTVEQIVTQLLQAKINRQATLCALGGGVIGDITGFTAAIYQRGISYIQIPTTLLAQTDAAIGGKTAVNHPLGKNMLGAFYQPKSVVIDYATLETLPDRHFHAGLAEVIKYSLIADKSFFDWIEKNIDHVLSKQHGYLHHIITQSCLHKSIIVQQDAQEHGLRAILNFGHSFAHAIEVALGFGNIEHGEAVAIGMVIAARLSQHLGHLTATDVARIRQLLQLAKLPTSLPKKLDASELLQHMDLDKKNLTNKLRLVLLKHIGQAYIYDNVDNNVLHEVIRGSYV